MAAALDIYSYLDYREFCKDFYETSKKTDSEFSYRRFAKKASVAGAYLKHVIDGRRNLSPKMCVKFGRGMDLASKEIDYFENLVRFNQAANLEEKSLYFERLRRKRARALKPIGLAEAVDLLSHWYVVAVKEIVVNLNSDDVSLVQKCLRKRLPENLIDQTIQKLKEMGWLKREGERWTSSASQIQFPDEVKSYIVRSFHRQMLEIAIEALCDDISDREFGAAMFTFPKSRVPELKGRIKEMQKDLISYVQDVASNASDEEERLVYHFGTQCFALQNSSELAGEEEENA